MQPQHAVAEYQMMKSTSGTQSRHIHPTEPPGGQRAWLWCLLSPFLTSIPTVIAHRRALIQTLHAVDKRGRKESMAGHADCAPMRELLQCQSHRLTWLTPSAFIVLLCTSSCRSPFYCIAHFACQDRFTRFVVLSAYLGLVVLLLLVLLLVSLTLLLLSSSLLFFPPLVVGLRLPDCGYYFRAVGFSCLFRPGSLSRLSGVTLFVLVVCTRKHACAFAFSHTHRLARPSVRRCARAY